QIMELRRFAIEEGIDFTVVGPEAPLCDGIVDAFEARDLRIFGPPEKAARLEGSKVFSKQLMDRHNIPTATFRIFDSADRAKAYIEMVGAPIVVKADGLAGGKAAIVCDTVREAKHAINRIMIEGEFGDAGEQVVVEDCLEGEEASVLAFTDGHSIAILPTSQDHKAIGEGDTGPNTGGMGAYCPAPVLSDELENLVERDIIIQTIHAMNREDRPYRGVLYAGLMIDDEIPDVLEFNCRFGDPEMQPLAMLLKSDIVPILMGTTDGTLKDVDIEWHEGATLCVVMASEGYPRDYETGKVIQGLDRVREMEDVMVFHSGTRAVGDKIVTDGGRVLGITARADNITEAQNLAYEAVEKIKFSGAYYRSDIGYRAVEGQKM
ncbi:MAG: phosphoribosylamine--glycine ligase, partial [Planctomycetota bacterium]